MITLIAAYTKRHRIIGKNGMIPWKIPEEMNHFKETTMGGALIFGRITFEEIGKALPGRFNVIISRTKSFTGENLATVHSFTEAVQLCKNKGIENIFICGGSLIYKTALENLIPEKLILSEIDEKYCGDLRDSDAFFPTIPENYTEIKKTAKEKFAVLEFIRKDYQC